MGSGREVQEERTYIYLWLIHADVWQKPAQYCKAIIFQFKINKKIFNKEKNTGGKRDRKKITRG